MERLPFLSSNVPGIGGAMRTEIDDFRVTEIPAYPTSGSGEHVFVTFEKRGVTTPDAVRAIARALGCDVRDCGYAGLKDRHAVTVQTASFPRIDPERALALELPNLRVLEARRHGNKLRTGHLHGNTFAIRVRGLESDARAHIDAVATALRAHGVPNYFGRQRFGREGDNATRAREWLTGSWRGPRDRTERRLLASSLQSELFNAYLATRLTDGLLDRYVPGDLAVRHPVGGPFPIDPDEAARTYADGTCSATGPMFGARMRWPTDVARDREERVLAEAGLTLEAFARAGDLAEGTRRAVRMIVSDLAVDFDGPDATFRFTLPAGGYATAVLREFRKTDDESLKQETNSGIESPVPDRIGG